LQEYDGFRKNPDAGWFELTEVKLWEGSSLTAWGANQMTPITALKGATKESTIDQIVSKSEAIEKFCRNSTATDETIEMLLLYNKQLTQHIIDLQTTEPEIKSTLPDSMMSVLKTFTNNLKQNNGRETIEGAA
jgi:hypothetical protein